jgi:hypothetical protein
MPGLVSRGLSLTIAALILLAFPAISRAAVPDPMEMGPYGVEEVRYDAGTVMMSAPAQNGTTTAAFQHPLQGILYIPTGSPGPWRALVFIRGNHSSCLTTSDGTAEGGGFPCTGGNIVNDMGYAYTAWNLASHGYVVMSLDTGALTNFQQGQDNGTFLRTQLIAASLDLLFRWHDGPGPGDVGYKLTGRLLMNQGVGIMGHSRGGDAVDEFPLYNRLRPAPGRKYKISGIMSVAPVDYERSAVYGTGTNGTSIEDQAYATLLPTCDGDVSNLQGARVYQRSLHAAPGPDPSPKIQFAVAGANHDYYNPIWWNDDGSGYRSTGSRPDAACGEDIPENIRLTPDDQRNTLTALQGAFFRRYVGGETAFEPMMTGAAGLPAAACAQARGVDCGEELKTTYFAPDSDRRDVMLPSPDTALTTDALGGPITGTGFEDPYPVGTGAAAPADFAPGGFTWCNPEPTDFVASTGLPTAARPCPLPPAGTSGVLDPLAFGGQANERENHPVNRSWGPQYALAWDGPARLDLTVPSTSKDVSSFKTLTMEAAVNYFDPRNPDKGRSADAYTRLDGGSPVDPHNADQDFDVVLTDRDGKTASVEANQMKYGTALEESLGTTRRHILLNGIRIPLTDFAGVDLSRIAKVSLVFGGRTASGSIELANMRFQELVNGPTTDPVIGPPPSSAPDALPSVYDAVGLNGSTLVPPKGYCADLRKPKSSVSKISTGGRQISVSGKAHDGGCAARRGKKGVTGRLWRVQVGIARLGAEGCRFVSPTGDLLDPQACSTPYSLTATGTKKFTLKVPGKLPRGKYLVNVQAVDARGNLEAPDRTVIKLKRGGA